MRTALLERVRLTLCFIWLFNLPGQIWWSSPISGPRRYEYEDGEWVFTRDDTHSMTLNQALKEEILQIYDIDIVDL